MQPQQQQKNDEDDGGKNEEEEEVEEEEAAEQKVAKEKRNGNRIELRTNANEAMAPQSASTCGGDESNVPGFVLLAD